VVNLDPRPLELRGAEQTDCHALEARVAELVAVAELVEALVAELVEGLEDDPTADPADSDALELRLSTQVAELIDAAELVADLVADSRAASPPRPPRKAPQTESPAISCGSTEARTATHTATTPTDQGPAPHVPGVSLTLDQLDALRVECIGAALDWTVGPTSGTLHADLTELVDAILDTIGIHLDPAPTTERDNQ
jgi:hypothetical protein